MIKAFYLNKEVAKLVGITQRQVLAWTEKGLIEPHLEATGGGSKRGYDYINLIEFGICKNLFDMGQGIQSTKTILKDIRNHNLLFKWVQDYKKFFKEQWMIGPLGLTLPASDDPKDVDYFKKITRAFQEMFVNEVLKTGECTGILFYSFDFCGGVFNRRPLIFPETKNLSEPKLSKAIELIYSFIEGSKKMIVINIGKIKNEIETALSKEE